MAVRLGLNGKFKGGAGGGDFSGKGELTGIQSLQMEIHLKSKLSGSEAAGLWIYLRRDASHGTEADVAASTYQFGQDSTGETWFVPAQLIFVNDAGMGQPVVGMWDLHETQVMQVELDDAFGEPTESIVLYCRKYNYTYGEKLLDRLAEQDVVVHAAANKD
ncbi:MAG TPA: hypothetical protein VFF73_28865 [Planctomycetota bacterium]|nr:hypothetical protein [Planctomycetota bacterium]